MANTQMERCPDCKSDDPKLCCGENGLGNPHPLGKWECCCKNPWHSTPAAPETAPDAAQQAAYKILRTVGTPSYVDDEQYNRDMAIAEGRIRDCILKFMGPFLTLRTGTPRKEEA